MSGKRRSDADLASASSAPAPGLWQVSAKPGQPQGWQRRPERWRRAIIRASRKAKVSEFKLKKPRRGQYSRAVGNPGLAPGCFVRPHHPE
jgi:hypothetical protein